jgi:hypothetical protein
VALLAASHRAAAQSYTWQGTGANGNWSTSGNWVGAVPPIGGGSAAALEFGGTPAQTVTVNNLVNGANPYFQLNTLTVDGDAANGYTIGGGPLRFNGTGNLITVNGGTDVRLNITSVVDFATATTIDITTNSTGTNVSRELVFSGGISGAGAVTVTSSGGSGTGREVGIAGTNGTYSGTLTVLFGRVDLLAPNAISRAAAVVLNGGSLSNFNGAADAGVSTVPIGAFGQQIGSLSGNSGTLTVGDASNPSVFATGFDNTSTTYGGTFLMNNAATQFVKAGTGTLTYTGNTASGLIGSVSIRDGVVNLTGNTGSGGGFNVSSGTQGSVAVYAGAEFRQAVTGTGSNGRFANSGTITLNGGTVRMDASGLGASGSGYSDVAGPLVVGAGQSTVRIDTAAGRGARFSFTSLTQAAATGTLFFQSGNLGTVALATPGAGNVNFGTTPTLVNGIIPYAFAADTATSPPTNFVTYDTGTGSVRAFAAYAAAFGTATDTVSLGSATTVSTATTANAVRLTAGGSLAVTAGLAVTSGAFLNAGGGDVTGTGTVDFGSAPAAYLTTSGPMTFSAPLTAANFVKSGAGALTLGGPVTLSAAAGNGVVAVNAGTLAVGAGAAFTNANTFQVARGANLDVTAAPLALGTGRILTGGGPGSGAATVTGNVALNSGGTVTPSALGGPDANRASPATLTVTGNLTLAGGSLYTWYANSALTAGDNTVPATAGTLANYRSPYTASELVVGGTLDLSGATAGSKITVKLTSLGLSNSAGPMYDLRASDTRSWVIAEAGSITGFSADKFNLDTSAFSTSAGTPSFSISQVGNALVLTAGTVPVPEPAAVLSVVAAAVGIGRLVRRGRGPGARA